MCSILITLIIISAIAIVFGIYQVFFQDTSSKTYYETPQYYPQIKEGQIYVSKVNEFKHIINPFERREKIKSAKENLTYCKVLEVLDGYVQFEYVWETGISRFPGSKSIPSLPIGNFLKIYELWRF
jgi:hypothetical protein